MVQLSKLWEKRCSDNFQMQLRYWNLIGKNSGLMFFLYAMVIIGSFYYKKWLDGLPAEFPGALLLCAVLTLLSIRSPVRTFTRPADQVFLLPMEAHLSGYFRKSRVYSFIMQCLVLFLILLVGAPLYMHSGGTIRSWIVAAAAVFAAKAWNIDCHWQEQFIRYVFPLKLLRWGLTFLLLSMAFFRFPWIAALFCLLVMILSSVFLYHRQADSGLLNWGSVIEMEERQAMHFLRFANLFADVPRLRHRVKARRLLSGLFPVRSFNRAAVYQQLFVKTFIRSDDYLGMYVRLTLIGSLACLLPVGYYTAFLVGSVVYLTGLQLLPLWKHPFPQALTGLYPVPDAFRQHSFVRFVFILLSVQSLLLSIFAAIGAGSPAGFPLFLAAGLAVSLIFSSVYIRRRVRGERNH